MVKTVHVCCGIRDEPHEPAEMRVDLNGVDIWRLPDDNLRLTEGREYQDLARELGQLAFEGLRGHLDESGGDYYGCGDRLVCPVCGTTIVWRV